MQCFSAAGAGSPNSALWHVTELVMLRLNDGYCCIEEMFISSLPVVGSNRRP